MRESAAWGSYLESLGENLHPGSFRLLTESRIKTGFILAVG